MGKTGWREAIGYDADISDLIKGLQAVGEELQDRIEKLIVEEYNGMKMIVCSLAKRHRHQRIRI
jgi:hypothetical protein